MLGKLNKYNSLWSAVLTPGKQYSGSNEHRAEVHTGPRSRAEGEEPGSAATPQVGEEDQAGFLSLQLIPSPPEQCSTDVTTDYSKISS